MSANENIFQVLFIIKKRRSIYIEEKNQNRSKYIFDMKFKLNNKIQLL